MFPPDLLAISRDSSMTNVAYVSTHLLEFSQLIELLLRFQFLKTKSFLNRFKYN
jgi:hypothetical protein